ncbi:MAG: hypothetical protein AB7E62_09800 [Methanothrix sp.]
MAIWLGGKLLQEIQEITFEIGMLGQYGPDIYDPQGTHVLRVLLGRIFSALELLCIMYAGFKRIEPVIEMAERLRGRELSSFINRKPHHSIILADVRIRPVE